MVICYLYFQVTLSQYEKKVLGMGVGGRSRSSEDEEKWEEFKTYDWENANYLYFRFVCTLKNEMLHKCFENI